MWFLTIWISNNFSWCCKQVMCLKRAGVKQGGRSMCACVRFPDCRRFQDFQNLIFGIFPAHPSHQASWISSTSLTSWESHYYVAEWFEECCVFGTGVVAQPMLLAAYPTPHDLQTSALSDQNSVPFYLYSSTEWVVVQGHSLLGFQQQGRLGMCVWDDFHDFSFPFPII